MHHSSTLVLVPLLIMCQLLPVLTEGPLQLEVLVRGELTGQLMVIVGNITLQTYHYHHHFWLRQEFNVFCNCAQQSLLMSFNLYLFGSEIQDVRSALPSQQT